MFMFATLPTISRLAHSPKLVARLIYSIGNGHGFTVLEVIDSVRRVTGRPIAIEEHGNAPAIRPCL